MPHLLLSSLPTSLENFNNVLLYGKENSITLDEVQTIVRSKELSKKKNFKIDNSGECLSVSRGRSESR